MNLFMLFMTIILAMVDPDLLRSISAPRATAQGCQVLPAKNVLPTYRSKSTQNVLEASQIKNDIIGHFGQRFESNTIWGNIFLLLF